MRVFIFMLKHIEQSVFFCTVGICLPLLLFIYRGLCILAQTPFLLSIHLFFLNINQILEPVFFCYLPTVLLFFILQKKPVTPPFFEKINPLLLFYSRVAKTECFFYENLRYGYLVLFLYFAIYLYTKYVGFYLEVVFLGCRTLVLSYLSFCQFFSAEYQKKESKLIFSLSTLSFFDSFVSHHSSLQTPQKAEGKALFSGVVALLTICLYKKDLSFCNEIQEYELLCDKLLSEIKETGNKRIANELYLEKLNLFAFRKRGGGFPLHLSFLLQRRFKRNKTI